MRLSGHQQHAQPVSYAVDLDDRGIVAVGQLGIDGSNLKLQHVHPTVRQPQRQFQILARGHAELLRRHPIDGNRQLCRIAKAGRNRALIVDAQGQHHILAQNGKGRRVADGQPAVPVAVLSGQQHMHRGRHGGGGGQVMRLPVGDQDRPGHTGARFLGQGFCQRGHQQRAFISRGIAQPDQAQFGIGQCGNFRLDRCQCRCRLRGTVADALAGAVVDHGQNDVRQRRAVFFLQGRVGYGQKQHRRRQTAQPPACKTAPQRHHNAQNGQTRGRIKDQPGQQRIEDKRAGHWPSLSSSAGTWTWSDL